MGWRRAALGAATMLCRAQADFPTANCDVNHG
jgi:hypothetical protein